MNLKMIITTATCIIALAQPVRAQSSYEYNSDNASAYSRFGIGTLANRTNGSNSAMAGAGLGLSAGNRINSANPASYSAVDSVTFLLDVGMTLNRNSISYNGKTSSSYNSRLTNVNMAFQLVKNLGLSIGYMPISSIGYDYTSSQHVGWNGNTEQEIRSSNGYFGTGGLHQIFIGTGWAPIPYASVGVNVGYLWGEYNHAMTQTFTEGNSTSTGYNSQTTLYQSNFSSYSFDAGVLLKLPLNKQEVLSLGATVGLGHNLGNSAHFYRYTSGNDTTHVALKDAFELPMTYGIGLAYQYSTRWKFAADFGYENWADCKLPILNNKQQYVVSTSEYINRTTFRLGGEFCPSSLSQKFHNRICYRVGAYYNSPYVKVNGQDGPSEYGITAGVSMPIVNRWNSRSVLNIGLRWSHVKPSASKMISEDMISLNLGITFNEQWFMKWRIQ